MHIKEKIKREEKQRGLVIYEAITQRQHQTR